MEVKDIVDRFNTTPFLFMGSGIARRYFISTRLEGAIRTLC